MCTIVAGNYNNGRFLFKNRDKKSYGSLKLIHEIENGVEIAYFYDQTGWVEGMNEFGIGFVFAYLEHKDFSNDMYRMDWQVTAEPKTKINNNYKEKIKNFKQVLLSKNLTEAKNIIEKNRWNGNYLLSDNQITYEIECFLGEVKSRVVELPKSKDFIVKTNHGILIPNAGHIKNTQNVARASSEIRKVQAEEYLMGFENYSDIIRKMGQQVFDPRSSLNVFRTDDYERTISQMLLDLDKKILHAVIYNGNSSFYGVENNLPKDYKPEIRILIRNKEEFDYDEFLKFSYKQDDFYSMWRNLIHSKAERKVL